MSTRLPAGRPDCRTTDHSVEIARMRDLGTEIIHRYDDANACPNEPLLEAVILFGAAGLLEVHDATGISLDDWTGPHEVVIQGLLIAGYAREQFLTNGV